MDRPSGWMALKGMAALGMAVGIGVGARQIALRLVGDAATPLPLGLLMGLFGLGIGLWCACFGLEWWFVRKKSLFSRNNSLVLVFIGLIYVIYSFLFLAFLQDAAISEWGQRTTATVTAKQTALRYDSDTGITHNDYFLEYRYTLPQAPEAYNGRAGVKRGYFDRLAEGDEITLYYWPWWPAGSVLEAAQSAHARLPFVLTAMLTLIGWMGGMGVVILASGPIR